MKEDTNRLIKAGSGHLADKAKLEKYAKLMEKKKARSATKPKQNPANRS